MEHNRHDNDFERISEYLDNRLSAEEAAAFKHALEQDTNLKVAYETILGTRSLLQHSIRRRAPHNFTLSEKTAGEIRKQRFFLPVLRLSSAFSAAASVIIFTVIFLFNRSIVAPAMMAAAPSIEKNASAVQATVLPPIIVWGGPVTGMGGGGGGGAEGSGKGGGGAAPQTFSAESQPMIGGGAPPQATGEGTAPTQSPESLTMAAPSAPETPITTVPEPTLSAALPLPPAADSQRTIPTQMPAAATLPAITGSGPILGIEPTKVVNLPPAQVSPNRVTEKVSNGIWMIVGAVLLLIAALAGLTSIYLGRKKH